MWYRFIHPKPARAFFMQKRILTLIGIVIIVVAGLLFAREKFGINLNPLSYLSSKTNTKITSSNIEIDNLTGYRVIPKSYIAGETVEIITGFKNNGADDSTDSFTFKAYKVDGVWDTLKKDIKYQDRASAAISLDGKDLFSELDLMQMIKEAECVPIEGNCYDNINLNDQNNKFGGVEVKFEEPRYEIKFDSTVASKASFTQNISFVPENCGYYMLVLGNKKYWTSAESGVSKVAFIAVTECTAVGQIASGVSDTRLDDSTVITKPAVVELPQAGATSWLIAVGIIMVGLFVKKKAKA